MNPSIRIRREIISQLIEQARLEPERECCGLLAGRDGIICAIFPAANAHENPATAYEIPPPDLFRMMRELRAGGLQLMGIYHSHPRGETFPSPRDVVQAYYPDAAYFILSPSLDAPQPVRAFSIRNGEAGELKIEIV